jgi:hypothetical protein
MARSAKRTEFLTDLLITAIENYGYAPWMVVDEYDPDKGTALIQEVDEDGNHEATFQITLDTMAHGLGIIRNAVLRVPDQPGLFDTEPVRHNAKTDERLFVSGDMARRLALAYRSNGEDGDYDVVDALAVLECAIFGAVKYA